MMAFMECHLSGFLSLIFYLTVTFGSSREPCCLFTKVPTFLRSFFFLLTSFEIRLKQRKRSFHLEFSGLISELRALFDGHRNSWKYMRIR